MEVIDQMNECIATLKSTVKTLEKLEKEARNLADKATATEGKRGGLQANIEATQTRIKELLDEREALKDEYAEAQFNGDTAQQRSITGRRKKLDTELNGAQQELARLHSEIEALDDFEDESVRLAIKLDQVSIPYGFGVGEEIKRALMKTETEIKNKVSQARRGLPRFDVDTYDAMRIDQDEEYAKRKAYEQERLDAMDRRLAAKAERAKYEKKAVVNGDGYLIGWHKVDRETGEHVAYEPIEGHTEDEVRAWVEDRERMRREARKTLRV